MWRLGSVFVLFVVMASVAKANDVAIVVGVTDYQAFDGKPGDLDFADEDARLFARTLIEQLNFEEDNVLVFTSKPKGKERLSSAKNIVGAFNMIPTKMVDPTQSKFVFYFSGHGLNSKDTGPFLAAQDYDPKNPLSGFAAELTAAKISQRLSNIPAKFAMAVYDMCRPRLTNSLNGDKETNRKFGIEKTRAESVATIFSATEGSSYEDSKLGHGVFTYYFCKGMTPEKTGAFPVVAGMDENGNVTLERLRDYIVGEIANASPLALAAQKGAHNEKLLEKKRLPEFLAEPIALRTSLTSFDITRYRNSTPQLTRYGVLRDIGIEEAQLGKFASAATYFNLAFELKAFGDKRDVWAALASAQCHIFANDLAQADTMLKKALAINSEDIAVIALLGKLYALRGNYAAAEAEYRRVVALEPQNVDAIVELGDFLEDRGDSIGAEAQYREAVKWDTNSAYARGRLIGLLDSTNRKEEAESLCRDSIKLFPEDYFLQQSLGILLRERQDERGAMNAFQRSELLLSKRIQARPDNADALRALIALLKRLDKKEAIIVAFRQLVVAAPNSPYLLTEFGDYLLELGDKKGAMEQFAIAEQKLRALVLSNPRAADICTDLGELLEKQDKPIEAIAQYEAAVAAYIRHLQENPLDATARKNLGDLFHDELNDKVEAEMQYREVLRIDPKRPLTWDRLLRILREKGDQKELEIQLKLAIQNNPEDSGFRLDFADLLKAKGDQKGLEELIAKFPSDFDVRLKLIDFYEEKGNLVEAVKQCTIAIEVNPKDYFAKFWLGVLLEQQENISGAEAQYRAALSINPRHLGSGRNLGRLLEKNGDTANAKLQYKKSLEHNPKDDLLLDRYANLLSKLGEIKELEDLVNSQPTNFVVRTILIDLLESRKEYGAAEAQCRAAILAKPTAIQPKVRLGNLLKSQGNINALEELIKANIGEMSLRLILVRYLEEKGNSAAAEQQFQIGKSAIIKDGERLYDAGMECNWFRDFRRAEVLFRAAIAANNKLAKAMYSLGNLLGYQKNLSGAEEQYRAAIAVDPKHADAMYNLGRLLVGKGDKAGAEAQFRAAIAANPRFANAMFNLALLLEDKKDLKGAEDQYRAAIAADPKFAAAMFNLALLLNARGDIGGAEQQYRSAISINSKYDQALNNLGVILENRNETQEAEKLYRDAIKVDPQNGRYHANLASVLLTQGKKDEALKEAKEAQRLGQKDHPVYKKLGI